QAPAATRRAPAHLDHRRVGQARQHRALLRSGVDLLPAAAPAGFRLVGGRGTRGVDPRRRLGHCPGHLAGWPTGSHPIATPRPGPRLGEGGVVTRPHTLLNSWAARQPEDTEHRFRAARFPRPSGPPKRVVYSPIRIPRAVVSYDPWCGGFD